MKEHVLCFINIVELQHKVTLEENTSYVYMINVLSFSVSPTYGTFWKDRRSLFVDHAWGGS